MVGVRHPDDFLYTDAEGTVHWVGEDHLNHRNLACTDEEVAVSDTIAGDDMPEPITCPACKAMYQHDYP